MLNRMVLMGRLTRDPEFRRTQSGISMAYFTLAVERDYKTQNGDRETDFINCIAWRHTAEFVRQYFSKGRMAVVEGRLQINSWVDQDGENRRSEQVVVSSIYFGDSKTVETSKTADSNNQEWAELGGEDMEICPFNYQTKRKEKDQYGYNGQSRKDVPWVRPSNKVRKQDVKATENRVRLLPDGRRISEG